MYIHFFQKNIITWSHFYFFLDVLCVFRSVFLLFCFILSTGHTSNSSFKSQDFWRWFVKLVKKLLFWLNSNLIEFTNIFLEGMFLKGKKMNETIYIPTELSLPHHEHNHILSKTVSLFWNQFLFTMKFISVTS